MEKKINFSFRFLLRALAAWFIIERSRIGGEYETGYYRYRGVYRKQAVRGHKRPCVYKRGAQLHRGGRGGGERRQRVARGEACVRAALRRVHNYTASHVGLHHRGRGAIFGRSNEHRELHYCRLRFGQHVGRAWEEEEKEHGQRGAALTISCVQKRENIKM